MAVKVTLDDIIGSVEPELLNLLKKDFREELDKRVTILDLSYEALKVNVYRNTSAHLEAYNKAYKILVQAASRIAKRKYSSLEEVPPDLLNKKATFPYFYIDGGDNNRFIVANSFGALDNFVKTLSRDSELAKTSFGTSTIFKQKKDAKGRVLPDEYVRDYRRKIDIGHIPTEDNENLTSPLEEKIASVMKYGSLKDKRIEFLAKKALADLYSIQADSSYSFKNTAPEAIALAKSKLGEGYVVVTLHRQKLNNKFSTEEARIFFNLKNSIAKILSKQPFEEVSGSNNILQDIEQAFLHLLDPKKFKKPKTHTNRTKTTTKKPIKATSSVKGLTKEVRKNSPKVFGKTYSNTDLVNLLNARLFEVIKSNMGTGSSTNVLNYRTGRFAKSVEVERTSTSRQGMITVFYTYMKNPYATFSRGGRQEFPRTRDPKTLISKSIRDIAQKLVSNQMRAVNV